MVCVPCIILPILLAIYVKFIQPIVLRFVPEAWKAKVDSWLYPTCPIPKQNRTSKTTTEADDENKDTADDENKDTADSTFTQTEVDACCKKDN